MTRDSRLLFLLTTLLIVAGPAAAAETWGGYAEINADSKNRNDTDVDVKAKLELDTRRVEGMKAHIEAEGSAIKREVYLEDVYIDYKFSKKLRATLGYSKKILGLEYETGKKKRLTVHRSPFYQKMESLGIVGRQINLRFDLKLNKEKKTGTFLSGALGGDNSKDFNVQLSLQHKTKYWGAGLWTLIESHRIDGRSILVTAETASVWHKSDHASMALELFHGVDAVRTEFQEYLSRKRTVHFMGPKVDLALHFELKKKLIISPVLRASLVFDDIERPEENTLHALGGVHLRWNRVVVSVNAETYGVNDVNTHERRFRRKSYYGQVVYYF